MIKNSKNALLMLKVVLYLGCCSPASMWAAEPARVFVSIVPQKYFVQKIGGDLVDVHVMVQPGADPHNYEPRPQQMVALSRATLYFAIGIEFERANLKNIISTNPQLKVVHTEYGIRKISMAAHHHHDEDGEQRNHGTLDPHIWLSPPLVKRQARTILTALQEIDPAHRSFYEANFRQFAAEIVQLDVELKKTFTGKQGLQFMVFHPSWGYFAQAYGLKQVPVEIAGKNPKPAQLKELIKQAREKDIKVVFVQPQFSSKSAKLLAKEIGGEVVFVDPLAENWAVNLRHVADQFKAALK